MRAFSQMLPKSNKARLFLALVVVIGFVIAAWCFNLAWSLVRWKAYIWVPSYITNTDPDPEIADENKHLIFVMVDHYEHGVTERAIQANKKWCDQFRDISNRYHDDYGNGFRYTWFYPVDHGCPEIMQELSRMAYEGYGEVEMHWHLVSGNQTTPENYPVMLDQVIDWFQQFGALITAEENPRTAFAYVAGSWDLDASRPGPKCHQITNQIDELWKHGCFADFTFSTIATPAQPKKVNAIYYATDDVDQPKSHNDGVDVEVGSPVDDRLMIFQGPISMDWRGNLEYAAIESDPRFSPERVDKWIAADIHVHGRPEWVFVKVYSHGAQSRGVVIAHDMEVMVASVIQQCREREIKLHFMSAREAYNVVKAAEAGESGNPEDFRDYRISRYLNQVKPIDSILTSEPITPSPVLSPDY